MDVNHGFGLRMMVVADEVENGNVIVDWHSNVSLSTELAAPTWIGDDWTQPEIEVEEPEVEEQLAPPSIESSGNTVFLPLLLTP